MLSRFVIGGCPKCGGTLAREVDASDTEYVCINCGFHHLIYRIPGRTLPVTTENAKQLGRFCGGKFIRMALSI